jgi:beta-galactosidase
LGQVIPVLAYTSCNVVELFLNGRSLGEKRLEFPAQGTSGGWNTYAQPVVRATTNDLHLSWDVPYEPGVLRAVGRRRDGTVACEAEVRTAGPPAAIRLSADRDTITAGPGDVALIRFEIVDSAGVTVPTAGDLVRFEVAGGTILALGIVSAARAGVLRLTASADGLEPASVSVRVARGVGPEVVSAADD